MNICKMSQTQEIGFILTTVKIPDRISRKEKIALKPCSGLAWDQRSSRGPRLRVNAALRNPESLSLRISFVGEIPWDNGA